MHQHKIVYAFDFDGTLTTKDTLLEFIRYSKGTWRFLFGCALFAIQILLMKLHILKNWAVKQRLFAWYFKGMSIEEFNRLCNDFAKDKSNLLRPKGVECVKQAIADGADVVIISASVEHWVRPFFEGLPVKVVGTQVEVLQGALTGNFASANCYGREKVIRLLELYPNRKDYRDSRGDRELLAFADKCYYRPFRK